MSATTTGSERPLYGWLVELADVDGILRAARIMRESGIERWDACTPFPVHGLDGAMGIRPTKLPWFVFLAGLTGCLAGLGLQIFTNSIDYPFLISGKPLISLPAFIPISFELTILLAAFAALGSMLVLNRLPELHHPLFASRRFRRVTDDRFFIVVEASDPRVGEIDVERLLESLGGVAIEEVEA